MGTVPYIFLSIFVVVAGLVVLGKVRTATFHKQIRLPSCRCTFAENPAHVRHSNDGSLLCLGGYEGEASLWDASGENCVMKLPDLGKWATVSSIRFSPDDKQVVLVARDQGLMRVFECSSGERLDDPKWKYQGKVLDASYNSDGELFAAVAPSEKRDVMVCRPLGKSAETTLSCGGGQTARFGPDAQIIATGGVSDTALTVWHCPSGQRVARFPWDGGGGFAIGGRIEISANNRFLAYKLGEWRQISIFDLDSLQEVTKLLISSNFDRVGDIVFSKDNRFLLVATLSVMNLWDLKAIVERDRSHTVEQELFTWAFTGGLCGTGSFSPSEPRLALGWGSVNGGPPVELWDVARLVRTDADFWYDQLPWSRNHAMMVAASHWRPTATIAQIGRRLPTPVPHGSSLGSAKVIHGEKPGSGQTGSHLEL